MLDFTSPLKPIVEVNICVMLMVVKLKGIHLMEQFQYPA